jgi:hypothetical protein
VRANFFNERVQNIVARRYVAVAHKKFFNPFRLQPEDISNSYLKIRYTHGKTNVVMFQNQKQASLVYQKRLFNFMVEGKTLGDLISRVPEQAKKEVVSELSCFYDFHISLETPLNILCDRYDPNS